jgi:hypothetical protein
MLPLERIIADPGTPQLTTKTGLILLFIAHVSPMSYRGNRG